MTRIAYCQQVRIALSTLGRYIRQRSGGQRLVRVNLDAAAESQGHCLADRATLRSSYVYVDEAGIGFPDASMCDGRVLGGAKPVHANRERRYPGGRRRR